MKFVKWIVIVLIALGLGLGIARALKQRAAKQQAAAQAAAAQLIPPVFDLLASDVLQVKVETVVQTVAITGDVQASVRATVKAPVAASVKQWLVQEGASVQSGQVLGLLDSADLEQRAEQAQQQAIAATAQAQIALRQLESNQSLAKQGFISPVALKSSEDNWRAAESNAKAAQAGAAIARKNLADATIRAPFDAQVTSSWVKVGDRVGVNAPLADLVDPRAIEVVATLPAEQLSRVKVGQTARLKVEGVPSDVLATVARINPTISAGNRSATLYLELPPAVGARPGSFVQGSIETGQVQGPAVPTALIHTEKPEPYLQILKDGVVRHIPAQALTKGVVGDESYTLLQGLEPGTTVLGLTAGTMASGTQVRVISVATK